MSESSDVSGALRVGGIYMFFAAIWVWGSDSAVEFLASNQSQQAWMQTYKGAAFVSVSALLIVWLVDREARRRSQVRRLFDELVELAPDPIVIRRYGDGEIIQANQRFGRNVGVESDELVGRQIDVLNADFDEKARREYDRRLAEEGEVRNYRHRVDPETGESVELLISSRLVDFGAEEYVCTVAKDITDLHHAYDETIRGWARALELRDDETFAHTLRVTRATIALAEEFGVADDQIDHIRRGALLHDIGKIGVPDEILLKDGGLDEEEWTIIEKHPVFAKELLDPIDYLQPALDIPYCHHEKWDGSGYPQGLEGEEIPLAARIFAVVDVWDALRSDRPYRDAWEPERVLEHLEESAGSHLQTEIVEAFLGLGQERRDELREVETEPLG